MTLQPWKQVPTILKTWPKEHQYLMSIDENGNSDLLGVRRQIAKEVRVPDHDRHFTATGVILKREDFREIRDAVNGLKAKYWREGRHMYGDRSKRICFHSREIRKREGPFSILSGEDYEAFLKELSRLLDDLPATIYASSIDKIKHLQQYSQPDHPYVLSMAFIVERFGIFLRQRSATGILLLESRGVKEDAFLLGHLCRLFESGNRYYRADHFSPIAGVYFNPKWSADHGDQATFITLELADLYSYPIHQFVRDGKRSRAYAVVEKKLANFPNYDGYGLKVFPKKK